MYHALEWRIHVKAAAPYSPSGDGGDARFGFPPRKDAIFISQKVGERGEEEGGKWGGKK